MGIEMIKGAGGDYDGQVACSCKILKGRVKRGPGKGRVFVKRIGYYDLESFKPKIGLKYSNWYAGSGVLINVPTETQIDDPHKANDDV